MRRFTIILILFTTIANAQLDDSIDRPCNFIEDAVYGLSQFNPCEADFIIASTELYDFYLSRDSLNIYEDKNLFIKWDPDYSLDDDEWERNITKIAFKEKKQYTSFTFDNCKIATFDFINNKGKKINHYKAVGNIWHEEDNMYGEIEQEYPNLDARLYLSEYEYQYFENQQIIQLQECIDENTERIVSYFYNGKIHTEEIFYRDSGDGELKQYYENGNLMSSGFYDVLGLPVGEWTFFSEDEQYSALALLDSLGSGKINGTIYIDNVNDVKTVVLKNKHFSKLVKLLNKLEED